MQFPAFRSCWEYYASKKSLLQLLPVNSVDDLESRNKEEIDLGKLEKHFLYIINFKVISVCMKIRVICDAQKSSRECIEFGNTMLNHKWLNRKQYLFILSLNPLTKILIPHALSFQERLLVF